MKRPGFSLAIILSLSLGIAVNIAVFSLVNAILLRPLPVRQPYQLVVLYSVKEGRNSPIGTSFRDYPYYHDRATTFQDLAASTLSGANLSYGHQTDRVRLEVVTGDYFPLLGIDAAMGRTFDKDESGYRRPAPVAVISYEYWKLQLGSSPAAIGSVIEVNRQPLTIIGVAPRVFVGEKPFMPVDLFVPVSLAPALLGYKELEAGDEAVFQLLD